MPERPLARVEPAHSSIDQDFARWLAAATLLLFTGPFALAIILVGIWWLVPSAYGRGRNLRPLVIVASAGGAGLVVWSLLGGSPVEDGITAQVLLVKAVILGTDESPGSLFWSWLGRVGPLAVGLGPSIALASAWKISRRAKDDHLPKRIAALALASAAHPVNGVLLGFMADGRPVTLKSRELAAHMLVAGATQAGKSTFVRRQVEGLSLLGHVVLVLDGKADPALSAFMRDLNPEARIWLPAPAAKPIDLLGGSPSEFAAKLIDVHRWTEPHYRAINHRYALQLGTYFALSGEPRTPASVVRLLVPDNLDAAADALSARLRRAGDAAAAEAALAITTYTAELIRDHARRLVVAGLADRFAGIVEGGLSGCLDDTRSAIRLENVLAAPGLWYMGMPGDTMPDEIAALGAWMLLELARVAHARRSAGGPHVQAHVVVEELSAFGHGALHLEHVLARARDAGIAVVVTTQALADVRAISSTLPDQLLANTGVQVFFHMRDHEAAWAASALGSGEAERETVSEDAAGGLVRRSRQTLTVPLVPARVLENFGVGDAILSAAATVTGEERRLERFRVALPNGSTRDTPRSSGRATRVLGASGVVLTAALVVGLGLMHSHPVRTARSNEAPSTGIAQVTVRRSQNVTLSPTPTRPPGIAEVRGVPTRMSPTTRWLVGNTDQLGVYLRVQPDGATLRAWPDNTPMETVGTTAFGSGGEVWHHVRAPDGSTGWVKERYLVAAP
jgi:hypothetical protein